MAATTQVISFDSGNFEIVVENSGDFDIMVVNSGKSY